MTNPKRTNSFIAGTRSRGCSPHGVEITEMRTILFCLLAFLNIGNLLTAASSGDVEVTDDPKITHSKGDKTSPVAGNQSDPLFDKRTFEYIKESLKSERRLSDVVLAVINTSTVLRCRPDKNFSNVNGPNGIKFIWRRLEEPTYLTFNYQRISQDNRYHVVMADFNELKLDLRIERVMPSDEGEYICLYRGKKLVYDKHVYLKVLIPSFINPNGSSSNRVVVREQLTQKLTCNASGVPAPTIKWYMSTIDGKARRVLTSEDQPRFLLAGSALVISNVTRDLRGIFTCVAYNGVEGKVSRNIHLDVYFRPTVKMGAEVVHRKPHQTTIILATVIGNPIYSLYWEFDHKPIRSVSGDCFFTLSGDKYCVISDREIANPMTVRTKLTIYNLTLEDYGTYTCVVHSPFGTERGSTELVREKEKRLDYLSPGEGKFFPNLWNPSAWGDRRAHYVSPQAMRTTTSSGSKMGSSTCLNILICTHLCISFFLRLYI